MDDKKIIMLFIIFTIFLLVLAPTFAKEKVKIKITQDEGLEHKGYIIIKLVDSNGRPIKSTGTIHYNITDSNGYYKWAYKSYSSSGLRLKYDVGTYNVVVKFDGDSKYSSAKDTKTVTVRSVSPYDYYDSHQWGLNQEIDDYIEYNYWDEEIYDDPYTYDGEGP